MYFKRIFTHVALIHLYLYNQILVLDPFDAEPTFKKVCLSKLSSLSTGSIALPKKKDLRYAKLLI